MMLAGRGGAAAALATWSRSLDFVAWALPELTFADALDGSSYNDVSDVARDDDDAASGRGRRASGRRQRRTRTAEQERE